MIHHEPIVLDEWDSGHHGSPRLRLTVHRKSWPDGSATSTRYALEVRGNTTPDQLGVSLEYWAEAGPEYMANLLWRHGDLLLKRQF